MNKYIANRFNKLLFVLLCIIFYTKETYAFKCVDAANNVLYSSTGGGVADLYVNLTPQIQPGQNLVVDNLVFGHKHSVESKFVKNVIHFF